MKISRPLDAALLALLFLFIAITGARGAAVGAEKRPKSARAAIQPVATVAERHVDEADLQRAALILADDPQRARKPAAWRRKLLDLCVDRELLALEAEREGWTRDLEVKRRIDQMSADVLYAAIRDRFLIPEVTPDAAQVDTARAGGLFRRAKISLILSVADKPTIYKLHEALRHGASFDSVAPLYSTHPSAARGGKVGWKRVGELNARSWREFQRAKPGDILGPYDNDQAHELYRVEGIVDPDDEEIRQVMLRDRTARMEARYHIGLLQKHNFRLVPDAVSAVIFAAATEDMDSILVSLDAEGRRGKRDVKPALGTIATVDGDSITYRDIAVSGLLRPEPDGKAHIEDSRHLLVLATGVFLPRLIERDAEARGLDRDPVIQRRLRLIGEEASTMAMVARAVPEPDSADVRAWFDRSASKYRRPTARRALVAIFPDEEEARAAHAVWARKAARDSIFALHGFRRQVSPRAGTLFPHHYAEVSLLDTDQGPISRAVRGLDEGRISAPIATSNGYALAEALGREPARAYRFDEVRDEARADARASAEDRWVTSRLERLRAANPARIVPERLRAVQFGMNGESGGNRR